jgi:mono/diheme cytochrome c family protein
VPVRRCLTSGLHAAGTAVLATLLLAGTLPAQPPPTPAQSISAGASIYGAKGCSGCHAINGIGAAIGPDLATIATPSLNALVSAMWGHLPQMADRFAAAGAEPPHLDGWEAADLMAFLFWAASATPVGSTDAGRALFTDKACVVCHQVGNVGGVLGPRLDGSAALFSSIELAAALWNHAPAMGSEMESRGVRRPTLSGADLDHLVAYLGSAGDLLQPPTLYALAGRPDAGRTLFRERGCIRCHRVGAEGGDVGPDLTRAARRQPAAFAAAMWNKGPRMMAAMRATGLAIPRLTGAEMADLVAYLGTFQYLSGSGSAARGTAAAQAGGCTACHTLGDLAAMTGVPSRSAAIAALWNHVRLPADTLRRAWRPLTPEQVADLVAYFERRGQTR